MGQSRTFMKMDSRHPQKKCLAVNRGSDRRGTEPGQGSVLLQGEIYRDLRFNLHWLTIQDVRAVSPLPNRIDGCRNQQRVTSQDSKLRNPSIAVNDCRQKNFALRACRLGHCRINRLHLPDQHSQRQVRNRIGFRMSEGRRSRVDNGPRPVKQPIWKSIATLYQAAAGDVW